MSLFTAISSLRKNTSSDSIGDDNIAVSSKDDNPYISPVAFSARNAYDTLHALMSPLIQGKKASLRQIDRWMEEWLVRLEAVRAMYAEMVARIKDASDDFDSMFSVDFAKEAWEIIQDTPILRRYMGEANYWYLYDTLGLLANQASGFSGDMSTGARSVIKKTLLSLISMTDGLLCLESHLAAIQQYWGALYLKFVKVPLFDSIVPNVTCAYWYKPPVSTRLADGTLVSNNPPGSGFVPVPLPIPDPSMALRDPVHIHGLDRNNPSTWYKNGAPYYLPNTMTLLERALSYWGSSYTDEFVPFANNLYPRRDYTRDGVTVEDHPLITGKTFAQLDTAMFAINGTVVHEGTGPYAQDTVKSLLDSVFTPDVVEAMNDWQSAYETARRALRDYLIDGFAVYGEDPSTIGRFIELQTADSSGAVVDYATWSSTDTTFANAVVSMMDAWNRMVAAYSAGMPAQDVDGMYRRFYDDTMRALHTVAHVASGYAGDLADGYTYVSAPSYAPTRIPPEWAVAYGQACVAYRVDTSSGRVLSVYSGGDATVEGDSVSGTYDVDGVAFVTVPSDYVDLEGFMRWAVPFSGVARSVSVSVLGVPGGLVVGGPLTSDDGTLLGYVFPADTTAPVIVGEMPDALYMGHSAGVAVVKKDGDPSVPIDTAPTTMANMFFPDGSVPVSAAADEPPQTFVTLYRSYMSRADNATEELADVVGYAINRGRETKFPCFGVYGELLSMQSWHYSEMPFARFVSEYAQIKSGSNVYYKKSDPSKVLYYHSSYMSQSRQVQMAVYHGYLERVEKTYGNDGYTFYVFPGESVSVSVVPDGMSAGAALSVDAIAPDGTKYHYITMANPIPKCAKYIDPEMWSIMDIIHEMYLLAVNLSDLCGDNGERLRDLESDLAEFNISTPKFIGQLPENNGQYSLFKFGVFDDYATRAEALVNSVYELREQLVAATNTL